MLDDLTRVLHMRDSAQEALAFIQGRTRKDLDRNRMLTLALVKCVEIIGEAANQVSKATQERYPDVPWRALIAMRHRTVHGYIDVDYDIVWRVATDDLPGLLEHLDPVISRLRHAE